MANLLDLLPPEEKAKAIERGKKRYARTEARKGMKISPEIYAISEFGYYYGWEAILTVKRGYIVDPITLEKDIFDLNEMNALLEGARKVWYSKLVEQGGVNTVSASFKTNNSSYVESMKPYTEKAELE